MDYVLKRIALFFLIISATSKATQSVTTGDILKILEKIKTNHATDVVNSPIELLKERELSKEQKNKAHAFNEEELFLLTEEAIKSLGDHENIANSEEFNQLSTIFKGLTKQLKEYKISGVGFAHHADIALLYSKQNFNVPLTFKDDNGTIHQRLFNLTYSSFGTQESLSWRFDAIFAIDTDLSRYSTLKPLRFSTGGTVSWKLPIGKRVASPFYQTQELFRNRPPVRVYLHPYFTPAVIGITILPFEDGPGTLVIAHLSLGLNTPSLDGLDQLRGEIVFSKGSLTPLGIDEENLRETKN